MTKGELIDSLARFPRDAKISVEVEPWHADTHDNVQRDIDTVECVGCNLNEVKITLGFET